MAWLNPGVKVKPGSQLLNKFIGYLQWYGLGIDIRTSKMALGLWPWAIMVVLRPIPRPYHYNQSLTYKYSFMMTEEHD